MRSTLAKMIPEDIKTYVEPFGGAAWVLLYKPRWAPCEVYNDLDCRLVNLFLQAKYHPRALDEEIRGVPMSRQLFEAYLANPGITEIQRAARFFFVINRSFGGLGSYFAVQPGCPAVSSLQRADMLPELSQRLSQVVIEQLDYSVVIDKYDRYDSFFLVDPPYSIGLTYCNSADFDHVRLHDRLSSVKGRWILTYDDSDYIRELYSGYNIQSVSRRRGIIVDSEAMYSEIIVSNYNTDRQLSVL